jgi:hypothetical protein
MVTVKALRLQFGALAFSAQENGVDHVSTY